MRFIRRRGALPALLPAILLAFAAAAQNPRTEPEVRVASQAYVLPPLLLTAQTSLVEVDVVVRRRDGAIVNGLGRGDFRVYDNGQLRPLAAFSVQTASAEAPAGGAKQKGAAASAPLRPAVSAAAPRSIALYFDDVNTTKTDLGNARIAAQRFVKEALTPGDRVAVFTASDVQSLALTGDRARLLATIANIRTHPRAGDSQLTCPRITAYQAYLISVEHDPEALDAAIEEYDRCSPEAVDDFNGRSMKQLSISQQNEQEPILAQAQSTWAQADGISDDTLRSVRGAVDYLARQSGSRMLLMASGGFLAGSGDLEQEQDDIVQDALHAGVVINALDAKGLYTDGPGRPLNEATDTGTLPLATFYFEETSKLPMRQEQNAPMVDLARSTGGLFFENNNDLTLGFERLGLIPEVTYELAFAPGDIPHDGKYHKLKVSLDPAGNASGKELLQYRPGYFAPPPDNSAAGLPNRVGSAMRGSEPSAAVAGGYQAAAVRGGVRVAFHLDAAKLPFQEVNGWRLLNLVFVAGLFRPDGTWVTGKQGEMDLALESATWKRFAAQGLGASLTVNAPAGAYRLRVVIADSGEAGVFAASQAVEVP